MNWIGKSSELRLHCFCLFDAYSMPKDMYSVGILIYFKNKVASKHWNSLVAPHDRGNSPVLVKTAWRTHRLPQLALIDVDSWLKLRKDNQGCKNQNKNMRLSFKLFILFVIFVACFELSNAKGRGGGRGKSKF